METAERIEEDLMPQKNSDGRDELNLAEFPLCALAHRLRPEQKTLRFEDRVWDEGRGEMITRQLIITGSDAYGLPTALDDEVLLGLIQLTRLQNFAERKVPFTRHQLLQILGWRDDSKSYARLEASLNRWTGVTLFYQRAWWNRSKQCWMDEKFHVLDNVWLCHRDAPAPDIGQARGGAASSALVWNEVLFRSFQAGNLKSLDFDFFKGLRSAVAKRLYRFLDKRFYRRKRWEFDLKEFAWEHAGLARSYDAASLKRKLRPGIMELEQKGFLQPMSDLDRFWKIRAGDWRVVFNAPRPEPVSSENAPVSADATALVEALTSRGITPSMARETARTFPAEQIKTQLEVFDWLQARQDPKVSRNPPGFLVCAIRSEFSPPRAFLDHEAATRQAQRSALCRQETDQRRKESQGQRVVAEREREQKVEEFWRRLSVEDRLRAEQAALQEASAFTRSLIDRAGPASDAARKCILDAYALKTMAERG